ncbi:hypothetical protein TTHERM_000711821 (macronuclear) [Tetrahymena thermophila SB210]|uniref:Uncharacterized protein n=1 Tax=Tetrahymena thermophila (strain SB210) TaxID=312017 RepID=W7XCI0_TETTS|nr:hypothetical protein TTHERM_000711821 [Tetrahymena thermophila SB210]EWS71476.1 hypothetical protein TTHERM_000711821 [Tetrahymena thermophila SB210]|eukprot:XP_012655979.1 hypothetical protein TTHERM_000711821 [Tetrahymena thermophila SB210]
MKKPLKEIKSQKNHNLNYEYIYKTGNNYCDKIKRTQIQLKRIIKSHQGQILCRKLNQKIQQILGCDHLRGFVNIQNIDTDDNNLNEEQVLQIKQELIKIQYGNSKEFYTVYSQKSPFLYISVYDDNQKIISSIEETVDEYKFLLMEKVQEQISLIHKQVKNQILSKDLSEKLLKLKIQINKQKQQYKNNFIIKENLERFPLKKSKKNNQKLYENFDNNGYKEQNNWSDEEGQEDDYSQNGFSDEYSLDYDNWSYGSCVCKEIPQDFRLY